MNLLLNISSAVWMLVPGAINLSIECEIHDSRETILNLVHDSYLKSLWYIGVQNEELFKFE